MTESKPIDHVQSMKCENLKDAMNEDLKDMEKNKIWESNKCRVGLQSKVEAK